MSKEHDERVERTRKKAIANLEAGYLGGQTDLGKMVAAQERQKKKAAAKKSKKK